MTRTLTFRFCAAAGLVLSLAACEGIRDQLGYKKQSPDEFKVVSRAPLTLPPKFNLRPPEPGAPRPQVGTAAEQGERAITGNSSGNGTAAALGAGGKSAGEAALLTNAGADQTTADIRLLVNRETNQINEEGDDFINRLVFWRDPELPGTVVDPDAEAKRLRENAALGRDAGSGETPTIERRKKALFEDLF